jgi:hypothetical protein
VAAVYLMVVFQYLLGGTDGSHEKMEYPVTLLRFEPVMSLVQVNRKVTQPILKYLLIVAIQYNSIELINTQYRSDYTRAHVGHVM